MEITVNKSQTAKYVVRSTVLSEEDLADVSDMEGLRSTLQIGDLRGTDSGNVRQFCAKIDERQHLNFSFHVCSTLAGPKTNTERTK